MKDPTNKQIPESTDYHNISLQFKPGVSRQYLAATNLKLNNIRLTDLSDSYHKSYMKFTDYEGVKTCQIKFSQKTNMSVQSVKPNGTAIIDGLTTKLTLQELSINHKIRKIPLPHNLPMEKNSSPVRIELSKKKKLVNLSGRQDLMDSLGARKQLFTDMINLVNKYQQLPEKDIRLGEEWTIRVSKKLALGDLFADGGEIILNVTFDNKLEELKNNLITLGHRFSGTIKLDVGTAYGRAELKITLSGMGKTVLDRTIGLEESVSMETDFDLEGSFSPTWRHKNQLGTPKIRLNGQVTYNLIPVIEG